MAAIASHRFVDRCIGPAAGYVEAQRFIRSFLKAARSQCATAEGFCSAMTELIGQFSTA
jgi:hypothetical protein